MIMQNLELNEIQSQMSLRYVNCVIVDVLIKLLIHRSNCFASIDSIFQQPIHQIVSAYVEILDCMK